MNHFNTALLRSLTVVALASFAGCDDEADIFDEDLELRVGGPGPIALIPTDVEVSFSVPLQPVGKFKPKSGFELHPPTNLGYVWTPDPTGDPDAIMVDLDSESPYAWNVPLVSQTACEDFLADYSFHVPVLDSVERCAQVERGCCDRVCYLWGGVASLDQQSGGNKIEAVSNETFSYTDPNDELDLEMLWGTYVDSGRMDWNMKLAYGGYDSDEVVCGCACEQIP